MGVERQDTGKGRHQQASSRAQGTVCGSGKCCCLGSVHVVHVHQYLINKIRPDHSHTTTTTFDFALRTHTHTHAILRSFFSSKPSSRFYGCADVTNGPTNPASRCNHPYSHPSSSTLGTVHTQWNSSERLQIFSLYGDDRDSWLSTNAQSLFRNNSLRESGPNHRPMSTSNRDSSLFLGEVQRAHKRRQILSQAKGAGRVLLACTRVLYTKHHPCSIIARPYTSRLCKHTTPKQLVPSTTAHYRTSVPSLPHAVDHPAQGSQARPSRADEGNQKSGL